MEEELISFETAKLAKEKGLPQDVNWRDTNINAYHSNGMRFGLSSDFNDYIEENLVFAPTQSLLQKWLREEHNIHVEAHPILNNKWSFSTYNINNKSLLYGQGKGYIGKKFEGETYEEALEKGLQEALTLIDKE